MTSTIISLQHVQKKFPVVGSELSVLKDISLEIQKGDFLIVLGPSGCGKSTLLHVILGLESPTSGSVTVAGSQLYGSMTEDFASQFRKQHIGMVYQQPNWIKSLNVLENTVLPLLLKGEETDIAENKASLLLEMVGMKEWQRYNPSELSSGQQQRVALARALITDPEIIIADEPTGNLDYEAGQLLMRLLKNLHLQSQKTIIMVTHDLNYVSFASRVVKMLDGRILESYENHAKAGFRKPITPKIARAHPYQLGLD